MPVQSPHALIHQLREAGLCGRYPEAAKRFLAMVVGDGRHGFGRELRACLDEICEAEPGLVGDDEVVALGRLI